MSLVDWPMNFFFLAGGVVPFSDEGWCASHVGWCASIYLAVAPLFGLCASLFEEADAMSLYIRSVCLLSDGVLLCG